jgi:hypothetical protein
MAFPVTPSPPGPSDTVVPGTPIAARVCRYAGADEPKPSTTLVADKLLTAAAADQLAKALDSGLRIDPNAMPPSCPADLGAADLVTFTFTGGGPVTVVVSLEACQEVTNGADNAFTTSAAQALLSGLVGSPLPGGSSQIGGFAGPNPATPAAG